MALTTAQKVLEQQLFEEMPGAEDLKELFSALAVATDSLKQSHDELGQRVRDLESELDRKNKALERKRRLEALGKIAAGVAHEIRNPLGSIFLYLDLLENGVSGMQSMEDLVDKIRKGVHHLSITVNDILTFTEPGEASLIPCDIGDLLEESIALMTTQANRQLKIMRIVPAGERTIMTDPGWLRRILVNLLQNACHAVKNNGKIRARVSYGKEVLISIQDDGPGISEEDMEKVFLPFWSKCDQGTGLGLSIVHSLVERLQGRIELENGPEGGLNVRIYLPYATEEPEGA